MNKLTKPLIQAILNDKLKLFIEKEFNELNDEEKYRTLNSKESNLVKKISSATPLIVASAKGDIFAVNKLIELGAKVNFANNESKTALHFACLFKNPEIVKILIKEGAETNKVCREGFASLYYALQSNLNFNTNDEKVFEKEKQNSLNIVQLLIENKANVNQLDKDGYNAYIQYIKNYSYFMFSKIINVEALNLFLEAGLDLEAKNAKGKSFIDLLGFRGDDIKKPLLIVVDNFLIKKEKEALDALLVQTSTYKKETSFKI